MRRALRLTPALFCLVAFLLALSALTHDASLRSSILIGGLYLENWNKVFGFGADGPTNLIGHTWSLATEEQFYLLWPTILLFIFRRRPKLWLGGAMAVMMAVRIALWRVGALDHLSFGLDARPIGLLVGSLLALAPVKPRLPTWAVLVSLGVLVIIGAADDASWHLIFSPLVVSLATAAIIVAANPNGLLAWKPAAYLGRISYGLYLYGFPFFLLGERWKVRTPLHLYAVGLIAVIFVVAALSYEFVEKPFLRLKDRLGTRQAMPLSVAAE
jgi:peptidoglycan/LPS O-acetylase OafA/YrhL